MVASTDGQLSHPPVPSPATKVVLSIRSMIKDPNPDEPMAPNIAALYKRERSTFEKNARLWTAQHAQPTRWSVDLHRSRTQVDRVARMVVLTTFLCAHRINIAAADADTAMELPRLPFEMWVAVLSMLQPCEIGPASLAWPGEL